jgi:hypothetical protein
VTRLHSRNREIVSNASTPRGCRSRISSAVNSLNKAAMILARFSHFDKIVAGYMRVIMPTYFKESALHSNNSKKQVHKK